MKRSIALFFLLLIGNLSAFGFHFKLGQSYDGAAKPRSKVAWIWVQEYSALAIIRIDGDRVQMPSPSDYLSWKVTEILPGRHVVNVEYTGHGLASSGTVDLKIDAVPGENYQILSDLSRQLGNGSTWNPTIILFSPNGKDVIDLDRKVLEHSKSVEGVVQKVEVDLRGVIKYFLLAVPGETESRKFIWIRAMKEGEKVQVDYFPSRPRNAVFVRKIE